MDRIYINNKEYCTEADWNLSVKSFDPMSANRGLFSYSMRIPDDVPSGEAILVTRYNVFHGHFTATGMQDGYTVGQFTAGLSRLEGLLPRLAKDVDLGTSLYTDASIETNWMTNIGPYDHTKSPIWYSLKYIQGVESSNSVPTANYVDHMWPDLHIAAWISALQEYQQIDGPFFSTEYFRRKLYPFRGKYRYKAYADEVTSVITGGVFSHSVTDSRITTTFDPFNFSGQLLTNPRIPGQTPLLVRIVVEYDITSNLTQNRIVAVSTPDLSASDAAFISGTGTVELSLEVQPNSGVTIIIEGDVDVNPGTTFTFYYEGGDTFYDGVELLHNSVFDDETTTMDILRGLSDSYNLVWFMCGNRLTVAPRFDTVLPTGEFVQGFYTYLTTDREQICEGEKTDFKVSSSKRTLVFSYKNDVFPAEVDLGQRYEIGQTKKKNSFFHGVKSFYPGYLARPANTRIAPYLDLRSDGDQLDYGPTLVYKLDLLDYGWNFRGTDYSQAPIAAMVLGDKVNMGYGDQGDLKGLVSTFYEKDIRILRYGVSMPARLADMEDVCSLFRDPIAKGSHILWVERVDRSGNVTLIGL